VTAASHSTLIYDLYRASLIVGVIKSRKVRRGAGSGGGGAGEVPAGFWCDT
jgi:hypothetical protein